MIKNILAIAMTVLLSGCSVSSWMHRTAEPSGPPLPMNVSCEDLIDHLNQQSGNLKAWQSTDVRMKAEIPGTPYVPPMKGSIACQSPNRFHLTASNLVASTDMGANAEQCWFLSTPGHPGVISWRHEDAHLLHKLSSPIPYIDPDWLMLVLGVKQLNADDYALEPGDDPRSRELLLTTVKEGIHGGAKRYVIKVNSDYRVVREHVAYDADGRVIVRAQLSNHKSFDGHLIPQTVRLEFPGNDAELTLSFAKIDTNPSIDSALWKVPSVQGGNNTDLIDLMEGMERADAQRKLRQRNDSGRNVTLGTPVFQQVGNSSQTAAVESVWMSDSSPVEPNWSDATDSVSPFPDNHFAEPIRRRNWLPRWRWWPSRRR